MKELIIVKIQNLKNLNIFLMDGKYGRQIKSPFRVGYKKDPQA
jgi:hypothetical protein